MLVISTIKENTYLGKKSPVPMPEVPVEAPVDSVESGLDPVATSAVVDDMDKSIDAMVKEA